MVLVRFLKNLTEVTAEYDFEDPLIKVAKNASSQIENGNERIFLEMSTRSVAMLGAFSYRNGSLISSKEMPLEQLLSAVLDLNEALFRSGGEEPKGMREGLERRLSRDADFNKQGAVG